MTPVTRAPRCHRRIEVRAERACARCRTTFAPTRNGQKFCGNACRLADWRRRHRTWALITWTATSYHVHPEWIYFPTTAAAHRAAPPDAPFTVVDVAVKPRSDVTFPIIGEIARRTRLIPGTDPYPANRPHRHDSRASSINPPDRRR